MSVFSEYLFDRDTKKNREIRYVLCLYDAFLHYKNLCYENKILFKDMDKHIWEAVLIEYGSSTKEMPNVQQAAHFYYLFTNKYGKKNINFHIEVPKKEYA